MNTDSRVKAFFERYERANAEFDDQILGSLYADTFMFGNPAGVQVVKKEDFLRVLPRRKQFFKEVGLVSSKIVSLETSELDARYVLVRVTWTMHFERPGKQTADSENPTTYVLSDDGNSLQIIFQIDHQDLLKRAQEAGFTK